MHEGDQHGKIRPYRVIVDPRDPSKYREASPRLHRKYIADEDRKEQHRMKERFRHHHLNLAIKEIVKTIPYEHGEPPKNETKYNILRRAGAYMDFLKTKISVLSDELDMQSDFAGGLVVFNKPFNAIRGGKKCSVPAFTPLSNEDVEGLLGHKLPQKIPIYKPKSKSTSPDVPYMYQGTPTTSTDYNYAPIICPNVPAGFPPTDNHGLPVPVIISKTMSKASTPFVVLPNSYIPSSSIDGGHATPQNVHLQNGVQNTNKQATNVQTTYGLATNMQTTNGLATNMQTTNGLATNMQTTNVQTINGLAINMQTTNVQTINGLATNMQTTNGLTTNMQTTNMQTTNMQTINGLATNMQTTNVKANNVQATNVLATNLKTSEMLTSVKISTNLQTPKLQTARTLDKQLDFIGDNHQSINSKEDSSTLYYINQNLYPVSDFSSSPTSSADSLTTTTPPSSAGSLTTTTPPSSDFMSGSTSTQISDDSLLAISQDDRLSMISGEILLPGYDMSDRKVLLEDSFTFNSDQRKNGILTQADILTAVTAMGITIKEESPETSIPPSGVVADLSPISDEYQGMNDAKSLEAVSQDEIIDMSISSFDQNTESDEEFPEDTDDSNPDFWSLHPHDTTPSIPLHRSGVSVELPTNIEQVLTLINGTQEMILFQPDHNISTSSSRGSPYKSSVKRSWINGYQLFIKINHHKFRSCWPEIQGREITRLLGEAWKDFPEEYRTLYGQRACELNDYNRILR